VFYAVLYLLKNGCQWDMLPSEFPKKSTVYYYFKLWSENPSETESSLLEQALKMTEEKHRVLWLGRPAKHWGATPRRRS
jgi:transposase